jgi:site-specific recombinase XerD
VVSIKKETIMYPQELRTWVDAFILDRKAQNLSPGTIQFYRVKLKLFTDYCDIAMTDITSSELRNFILHLSETHKPGGVHCVYRAVRAFLSWYENEVEDWRNPIHKVRPPKVPSEPLNAIPLQNIASMIRFSGDRDKAILLALLDTGARAMEFLNINTDDVNISGEILIRQGKGRKPRTVYLGAKSRKAVRAYLKQRGDNNNALWITDEGTRLTYTGLRMILRRRAKQANIPTPPIHAFRRAFAISMLRGGTDLITLANLMGHTSLSVLQRYLKQTNEDTRLAHVHASPVDNNL